MNDIYNGDETISWDAMRKAGLFDRGVELSPKALNDVLAEVPRIYANGRLYVPNLSEMQYPLFPYLGARYGLDTRATVERLHSEYMETVSHILSISGRLTSALNFSKTLFEAGLITRDALQIKLAWLNHAGLDRVIWEAEYTANGTVVVRSRLNK